MPESVIELSDPPDRRLSPPETRAPSPPRGVRIERGLGGPVTERRIADETALSEPPDRRRSVPPTDETVLWSISDIQSNCRISRSSAWRMVRGVGFPEPVALGRRRICWMREEVVAFMETHRRRMQDGPSEVRPERRKSGDPAAFISRPLSVRRR